MSRGELQHGEHAEWISRPGEGRRGAGENGIELTAKPACARAQRAMRRSDQGWSCSTLSRLEGARGDGVMRKAMLFVAGAVILQVVTAVVAEARVVRFVVEQTRRIADGKAFGDVGPYERLDGTVYMEVDPRDPLNAGIVNLDKAPRTPKGMVGFSSPFYILKPVDMARGNRKIFYGVNNRGNKIDYAWRTILAPTGTNNNNPVTAADFGDGFLMRLGYTYVDAGWQGNVAPGNDRLVPNFPIASQSDGRPIVAKIRVEYVEAEGFTRPLEGSPNFRAYETADMDTAHATLTIRNTVGGAKTTVPADRWAFGRCQNGQGSLVPTSTDVCVFDGFK